VGSHTTLVQFRNAVSPKLGSLNRKSLLPDPAEKSTFPVGSNAACTANTSELNGNRFQLPSVAGSAPAASGSALAAAAASGLNDVTWPV
jgi:hypothetical protein